MNGKNSGQLPRVSIVIPCYNSAELISETLDCAVEQDYENKEIIVIDDGSTDNSPEIVKSYGSQITLVTQENAGVSAARNHGIKIATGDYLQFLDSDDLILPGKIRQNIERLTESEGDCTIAEYKVLKNGQTNAPLSQRSPESYDSIEEYMMYTSPLIGRCLYNTDLVRRVGGFDSFRRGEDHLFQFKLLAAGARYIHVPETQFLYREHEQFERLSGLSSLEKDPYLVKEKNREIERYMKEAGKFDETARKALSFNSYRQGLRYYGIGKPEVGDEYVSLSKEYWDPPVVGGPRIFRVLNRILGCRRVGFLLRIYGGLFGRDFFRRFKAKAKEQNE